MDPATIAMLASAAMGGANSFLNAGKAKREAEHSEKLYYNWGLPMQGINQQQYRDIWTAMGEGTFNPNDPRWKNDPLIDIMRRGGIGGIRKDYGEQFIQNINEGYKGATQSVHGQGRLARQGIAEERTKGMADVGQSMQDAGLVSSNIAQQAKANVGYQTSKALSGLNTEIAGMLSQLKLGKSQAMDAALQRNLGLETQTANELMGYLTHNPMQPTGGPSSADVGGGTSGVMDLIMQMFQKKSGPQFGPSGNMLP